MILLDWIKQFRYVLHRALEVVQEMDQDSSGDLILDFGKRNLVRHCHLSDSGLLDKTVDALDANGNAIDMRAPLKMLDQVLFKSIGDMLEKVDP